jgi:hypothetical protein
MVEAVREANMGLIVGAYTSWTDYDEEDWCDLHGDADNQLRRFEEQLREVQELNADDVLHRVNIHAGSDSWTEEQTREYFNRALPLCGELPISHETHRGRPLANPFLCHRLCQEFSDLRLTLDASHWFLICERLIGSAAAADSCGPNWESSILSLMCERVDHIHARIGTPESPQLGAMPPTVSKGGTAWELEAAAAHEDLWVQVWRSRAADGDSIVTATPEYGPTPYTPMAVGTGEPLTDVWEVTNDARARLEQLFMIQQMAVRVHDTGPE